MKSSIMRSFICASFLMVLAMGCGKDNGSGNGGGSSNTYLAPNVSQNAKTNFEQLKKWYSNSQEGQLFNQPYFRKAVFTIASQQPVCEDKELWGFLPYQYCKYSNSNDGQTPQSISTTCLGTANGYLVTAPGALSNNGQCTPSKDGVKYAKSSNAELKNVITLQNGSLALYDVQIQGSYYIVIAGPKVSNGFTSNPSVIYVIDTAVHSVYNPVQTQNITNSTIKKLY
jgi:hypothetical protein